MIDGHDIWPLWAGQAAARSPYKAFYLTYHRDELRAVRSGKWKLDLPVLGKRVNLRDGRAPSKALLYDLDADVGETINQADDFPDVVARLSKLTDEARADLGNRNTPGCNQRTSGTRRRPAPAAFAAIACRVLACLINGLERKWGYSMPCGRRLESP